MLYIIYYILYIIYYILYIIYYIYTHYIYYIYICLWLNTHAKPRPAVIARPLIWIQIQETFRLFVFLPWIGLGYRGELEPLVPRTGPRKIEQKTSHEMHEMRKVDILELTLGVASCFFLHPFITHMKETNVEQFGCFFLGSVRRSRGLE